ncbi:cupin domain-containing protein [Streptomyces albus]|uniref:cupin domain-containing protein n=1 Tax=Streptomyces albus TaxID=1888 RepID=UPI0033FF0E22
MPAPTISVTGPDDASLSLVELYDGITAYVTVWSAAPERRPVEAYLQFSPGAAFLLPEKHTDSSKTVLLLEGVLQDEHGSYGPGTRMQCAIGTEHTPRSDTGALAYVIYPEREPAPADTEEPVAFPC